jgi:hypothetical protein
MGQLLQNRPFFDLSISVCSGSDGVNPGMGTNVSPVQDNLVVGCHIEPFINIVSHGGQSARALQSRLKARFNEGSVFSRCFDRRWLNKRGTIRRQRPTFCRTCCCFLGHSGKFHGNFFP